ncbi:hypothetical protein RFI_16080, partial [Reticulomyxa filosa]
NGDQGDIESSRQQLLNGIEKDNKRWEETLKIQEGAVDNSHRLWTQRDFARQEMQGRIDDLQKLRNLHKRNTEQVLWTCEDFIDRSRYKKKKNLFNLNF